MENITPFYTAEATGIGGRNGHVRSSDGIIDLDVKMPTQLGGQGGHFSNPEQLFAAGYAACFGGAMGAVAAGRNIADAEVNVHVSIGKSDAGGFGIAAELNVRLPHLSLEEAQAVVNDAHQACPYSKATRGNIAVVVRAVE